jgi:hypothetical protein
MTEREAWQRLAIGVRDGTYRSGLCPALAFHRVFGHLPSVVHARIQARIDSLKHSNGLWVWRTDERGQNARATYCMRQVARLSRKRKTAPKQASKRVKR